MGNTFCDYCTRRFATIANLREFFEAEEEILNSLIDELGLEAYHADTIFAKAITEKVVVLQHLKTALGDISFFLLKAERTYALKQVKEIYEKTQQDIIDVYLIIKENNYPTIVSIAI